MRRSSRTPPPARARPQRPPSVPYAAANTSPAVPDLRDGVKALSEGALHITVYELLAHAYNRVAIQYYHDQGAALLTGLSRDPAPLFAPALPPPLQREVVSALFADSARALATFFDFEEMNFLVLDHEERVYRLAVREGTFFPNFQPGSYRQAFGTGLLGQCHLERRTIVANDVSEASDYVRTDPAVRAELAVPVVLGDAVLAIIDAGSSRVNAFTETHASFIEGFARYLAPAIADPWVFLQTWRPGLVHGEPALAPLAQSLNFLYAWQEEWRSRFAQLYLEAAQRNAELLALIDLSESLSGSLQLDTILTTTVAKVAHLLSCQVSWILLPDDEGRLRMRALHGGSAGSLAAAGITQDGSPQFAVVARGEPVITNELERVPRSSFDWEFCSRNGITRYLTVPLRVRERTIGVMNVGRTHTAEDFAEKDVRLLSTFASQIALAIENADLYERSRLVGAMEERNRLARDLHDTLVQSIVGILHSLEDVSAPPALAPLASPQQNAVARARALALQSLDEARRSVWNLHPAELVHKELWEALRDWADLWSRRAGVELVFRLTGVPEALAPNVEADVLRVAQESLGNVSRHARASHVDVSLEFTEAGLRLTVSDNGIGFDPADADQPAKKAHQKVRPSSASTRARHRDGVNMEDPDSGRGPHVASGFGLHGMRERAHLIGGWLQVESAPGWGTRVLLTIPAAAGRGRVDVEPAASRWPGPPAQPERATAYEATPGYAGDLPASHTPAAAALDREQRITILLADDHPTIRDGLQLAFTRAAGFELLGAAASAQEAVELARTLRPDVLLLDMHLPDDDGLSVLRQLRDHHLPTRTVILTAHIDDAHIAEALQAGAAGYLEKGLATRRLVEAVQAAAQGRLALSPAIAARMRAREGLFVNPAAGHLTVREREVLPLLAAGLSYSAIAERLSISVATVKFHIIHLYQKLQCSTRIQALNRAREWGLLR